MAAQNPDEDGPEPEPIYSLAEECESLFHRGRSHAETLAAEHRQRFDERQQRFSAWASDLGVFAPRTLCLDHRLRNYPDLQDLVLRLLDILRENLMQCASRILPIHHYL
jgi:hypothetical protein